jgi:hypothetical protein
MKNLLSRTSTLAVAAAVVAAIPATAMAGAITVDGVMDANDDYTNSFIANWTNEHHTAGSVFTSGTDETTVWWEANAGLFYLFVEAPLEAKNMIWGAGVTAEELALYDVHNTSLGHHGPLSGLDYGKATGSEKAIFGGMTADLDDDNVATSRSFLIDNGTCDTTDCAASGQTMSFEFGFNMSAGDFANLVADIETNGIQFHLSPERGGPGGPPPVIPPPVPTPATLPVMFLGMLMLLASARRRV